MKRKTILFVCRGNILRSAVAEFVLNSELKRRELDGEYLAISRGIQGTIVDPEPIKHPNIRFYSKIWKYTKPALEALGIDLSSHIAKPIDDKVANKANLILAMDDSVLSAICTLFPKEKSKMYLFSEVKGLMKDISDASEGAQKGKQLEVSRQIKEIIIVGFPKLVRMVNS